MTYKELGEQIKKLNMAQLSSDVTVYVNGDDEYYPEVSDHDILRFAVTTDALDKGHPFLVI